MTYVPPLLINNSFSLNLLQSVEMVEVPSCHDLSCLRVGEELLVSALTWVPGSLCLYLLWNVISSCINDVVIEGKQIKTLMVPESYGELHASHHNSDPLSIMLIIHVVAVSCGYDTCFAVRACDGLLPPNKNHGSGWNTVWVSIDRIKSIVNTIGFLQFLPTGQHGLCFGYLFSGPLPLRSHIDSPPFGVCFRES